VDFDWDPDDEDDGDNARVTPQVADLSLKKTVDVFYPMVGDIVKFTITVENDGPNDATGVVVVDEVPNGFGTPMQISNSGVWNGSVLTWSNLSIPVGGSIQLTYKVEVLAPGPGISHQNIAIIEAADQYDDDSTPGNDADADGDGNIGSADMDDNWDPDDEDDGDDAYVIPAGAIGDFVWEDVNGDGKQDITEAGIPGVQVELYDGANNLVATTVTSPTGMYVFDYLVPGNYRVKFVLPAGYDGITLKDVGVNDAVDSDADPVTGYTDVIAINSGEENYTVDAGLFKFAQVGDFVWRDDDADGLQEAGEPGLNGILVKLLKDNIVIQTTTTQDHPIFGTPGYYVFENLPPGEYTIMFGTDAGLGYTVPNAGNDQEDSDADPATGMTDPIVLSSGEVNYDVDAGLKCLLEVDLGPDLTICVDETIELTAAVSNGKAPYAYQWSHGLGNNPTVIVSPLVTTTYTVTVTDANGCEDIDEITVVVEEKGSIGDRVWFDLDGDGEQDPNEVMQPNIANVRVELLDTNENVLAVTYTNANGNYIFDELCPGKYKVKFYLDPVYRRFSQEHAADDHIDSDADRNTGITPVIELHSGEHITHVDCGMYRGGSIGDFVWIDANGNGSQDPGEEGLDGVVVKLFDATTHRLLETVVTGDDPATPGIQHGYYQFDDYDPGYYYLQFMIPAGYVFTIPNSSSDVNDSDVDGTNGPMTTKTYFIDLGEFDRTVDAGVYLPASLGDFVWEDTDGDGIQDPSEAGVPGVTVELYRDLDGNGQPDGIVDFTTTTNAQGYYSFPTLPPGRYYVKFTPPSQYALTDPLGNPAMQDVDSDPDPTTGMTGEIVLAMGEHRMDIDAGLYAMGYIGDFIWLDANGNGMQDASEMGVNGLTVELYSEDGVLLASTVTANHPVSGKPGYYLFDNLKPGAYYIKVILPSGYDFTPADMGYDAFDSDITHDHGYGTSSTIHLQSGEENDCTDIGIWQVGTIAGRLWEDRNGNGIQEYGEPGINGVTVRLYEKDGSFVAVTTSSTNPLTGEEGWYEFTGLQHGQYYVAFDIPAPYLISYPDQTMDDKDSDITHDHGANTTSVIVLNPGASVMDVDGGIYLCAEIGDFVWLDTLYENGVQDPGEPGLAGVTVELFNDMGDLLESTVTDATGYYSFCIPEGYYYLRFNIPSNMSFTAANASTDDQDSDVTGTFGPGTTNLVYISYNTDNPDIDAGVVKEQATLSTDVVDFRVDAIERKVLLQWTVLNGIDHVQYEIWKSSGKASNFERLRIVRPQELYSDIAAYKEWDADVQQGWYYYQLRTIYEDGSVEASPIRAVYVVGKGNATWAIQIIPNPVVDEIAVRFDGVKITQIDRMTLYDVMGKVLWVTEHEEVRNERYRIGVRHLSSGVYYLEVVIDNQRVIERIIKR